MRRRGRRLVGAVLVVVALWPLTSCEKQVRGQILYAGDVTAVDASPWVQERVTLGTTGLLVSVNSVDEAGVAATDYWVERLPALADATGGFDAVVLSLGVTDLMAGESPTDLAERVDAIAAAAASVASRGVYWSTLDETIPGYEEEATALNDALAQAAAARPTLHLLDFGSELAAHPTYREDEGLRWTTEGEQAFAELVDAELVNLLDPPVPGVSIVKSADEAAVVAGADVHLHVEVTNTGEVDLHGVTVDDPAAPGCAGAVPDLAPGESVTVDCTVATTNEDVPVYTNVASVDTDETDAVASAPVTVPVTGTNVVRLKVRWRGDGPDRPVASVRLRCAGATPTVEQVERVTDQLVRDLTVPADRPSCVVHQLTVKGVPTTAYDASSSTAETTVTATAARLVFAVHGGEQAKVVVTNTFPGRCPAGQPYY